MSSQLRDRPSSTPAMLAVFDDDATIRHALAFELALARAEAAEGIIEDAAATAIAEACAAVAIVPADLARHSLSTYCGASHPCRYEHTVWQLNSACARTMRWQPSPLHLPAKDP